MPRESIEWFDVEERLPDADMAVLINAPNHSEPVWIGWYDGVFWFEANGLDVEVRRWAKLPTAEATQS